MTENLMTSVEKNPSSLHNQPILTLRFSSFVGILRLLNCRVKFCGPEGIFCGVWKVWPGLEVLRLCGNRAVLLSAVILFYWMWRLLLESVQLEMCLPILEGIGHAWIFLPPPVFAFTELFIACAAETWVFTGKCVAGRGREGNPEH